MIVINNDLYLDNATDADALYLFKLKNDPGSRASALVTTEEITWHDHIAWLRKALINPNMNLYIIRKKATEEPLGSWRFDLYPDHVEFSMIIDPALRGQRIGSTVFAFCSDYIQERTGKKIIGYIAEGNVPPMRYHMRTGYKLESYDPIRKCYVWTREPNWRQGFADMVKEWCPNGGFWAGDNA